MAGTKRIYQLKITLEEIRPPIWRRILVTEDITLGQLHHIIQTVMGWHDCHLHAFRIGGEIYGEADPELNTISEKRVKLSALGLEAKAKFEYEYDFGDSWTHRIQVEKILPEGEGAAYPVCITGKRACPPEDCGGPWGYETFVDIASDPDHPEHVEMMEWLGGGFDPEDFDMEAVNKSLLKLK
jgi:hypothetical protein